MKVSLAFALIAIIAAEPLPSFSLPEIQVNYDRTSINGIPSIDIKFRNGHQDHFVLNRHYTSEENRIENELNCNFIGHLANEKTACVAVTGCSGKDMEFTILSKHSQNSLFKLSMDGKLEALDSDVSMRNEESETENG